MLTASHNPAEYLGFKIKMADGGSAPPAFTARVEAALPAEDPGVDKAGEIETVNLVADYLDALKAFVDARRDPGRGPLAWSSTRSTAPARATSPPPCASSASTSSSCTASPIPASAGCTPSRSRRTSTSSRTRSPSCGARRRLLHRRRRRPHRRRGRTGDFVNPHRIIAPGRPPPGRGPRHDRPVVKTLSTSVLVDRIARHLGLEVVTTPVGFKCIYEEMVAGDVLIGGEESGGIGIPAHVRERDGLLMALLLAEMMAQHGTQPRRAGRRPVRRHRAHGVPPGRPEARAGGQGRVPGGGSRRSRRRRSPAGRCSTSCAPTA